MEGTKVIEWTDAEKNKQKIVKRKVVKGHEKSYGYMLGIVGSVLPTVVIGVVLMGTCVYRANKQKEEFAAYADTGEVGQIEPRGLVDVRVIDRVPDERFPGMFPAGKPELVVKTPTPIIEVEVVEKVAEIEQSDVLVWEGTARYSYYWPPLGGINCEEPCEMMAGGDLWNGYVGVAVACPVEWDLGSRVVLPFGEFVCMDRGGMIVFIDGIPWIDHLSPEAFYNYGYLMEVRVYEY